MHANSTKVQECRNSNFRLSTNSGCFSLLRRPLPASFLCCVVLCWLLFSVASSSACFFSLSHRLLPASRRVILCLLFVTSSSACFLPLLCSWILLVLHL